jgi:hypothetical protein
MEPCFDIIKQIKQKENSPKITIYKIHKKSHNSQKENNQSIQNRKFKFS